MTLRSLIRRTAACRSLPEQGLRHDRAIMRYESSFTVDTNLGHPAIVRMCKRFFW